MNLNDRYNEASQQFREIRELIDASLDSSRSANPRDKSGVENALNDISHLLAEMSVAIFTFRQISWDVQRDYVAQGSPSVLFNSVTALRAELKDNVYSLAQSASSMQERARALRGFLAY